MGGLDFNIFSTSQTELPEAVIPKYVEKVKASIAELENDLLVTQKQLVAANAVLDALEQLK